MAMISGSCVLKPSPGLATMASVKPGSHDSKNYVKWRLRLPVSAHGAHHAQFLSKVESGAFLAVIY